MTLLQLSNKAITLDYSSPNPELINSLNEESQLNFIEESRNIKIANSYYQQGLPGTREKIYARNAIIKRLNNIAKQLAPNAGVIIFDVFRSLLTQQSLFEEFYEKAKLTHPKFSEKELFNFTRQFVFLPDPNDITPPHNTGGTVDLAIYDIKTNQLWDFGSEFDEMHEQSYATFFEKPYNPNFQITEERWHKIRHNRRILHHLMILQGFTALESEWWHFNLGNEAWAKELNVPAIYFSAEKLIPSAM